MRNAKSFLAALTAFLMIEFVTLSTPLSTINHAYAETLSPALQFKVKKLSTDIAKSRSNLASDGPALVADAFKARQFQQRLDSYAASLGKMPDVDDPALADAKTDLAALQKEFEAAMKNDTVDSDPPPQSAQTNADSELVSGQRVQVKKLAKDISNVTHDIIVTGPSPMQSGEVVGKYNKRLQQFADALGKYAPYKNDPDVREAANNYQGLVSALKAENARAQDQLQQLGNVQARLATVNQNLRARPAPDALYPPFTEADAKTWVEQLADAKKTAQSAAAELESIAPLAYLPENTGVPQNGSPYDSKDLQSLFGFAQGNISGVDEAIKTSQQTLKDRFDFQEKFELKFFRELDPASEHHRMNFYLKEGAEGEILAGVDKEMQLAQSVAAYQRAFGKEPTTNTQARIDEIVGIRKKYLDDRRTVLGDSKLPEPASTDGERIAIAEKILANKDYEFGQHGPVVLTTEKILTREKEVSRDTIKDIDVSLSGTITLSGTRESWHYKWDEFKFATPIKDDSGDWYIWWIEAKKYESGWDKTPIGYWISGNTVKGSLILPDNF